MISVVRDVTERKRTEAALRESEERFRTIADGCPTIIWVTGTDGGLRFANHAYRTFFGVTYEQVQGGQWQPLVHPDDAPEYVGAFLRALRERAPFRAEARVRRADGEWRWIESYGEPRWSPSGEFSGYGGISPDITERKQAAEALRESEAVLRSFFDSPGMIRGIVEIIDGRIVHASCNAAAAEMFGVSRESISGKSATEAGASEEIARSWVDLYAESRRTGQPVSMEYARRDADGHERWLLGTASYLGTGPSGKLRFAYTILDLTERKRAEAQLMQAQKMESVGRLAGGVAHDFNNLLTIINGYSRMLLDDLHPEDTVRDALEEIHKAGERAAGLTQQLLAFSRKQVLQPRALDLSCVVGEMRPMLARLMGEDVEVSVVLHAEATTIRADPHQLAQVVMNLAANSRDAMPRGGKFLIETDVVEGGEMPHSGERGGPYAMLAVSDSGVGIDEETRRHIFEPFYTTKPVGKGTGLGLSMVQGIVEQSGGHIEVQSAPGHGTTFRIYLPVVRDALPDPETQEKVPAIGGTATVLVVEDQTEVRKYAVIALEAYGYKVMQAETAAEALLFCERERDHIDLVLTDVVMPNVSGGELAGRLRKRWSGIKVLFMSGYTDDAILDHGGVEGAEFIQKPFSPDELATRVRDVLAG